LTEEIAFYKLKVVEGGSEYLFFGGLNPPSLKNQLGNQIFFPKGGSGCMNTKHAADGLPTDADLPNIEADWHQSMLGMLTSDPRPRG
jgi:hypothetical protein